MYRVTLTDAQRDELHRRAHASGVAPRTRDRLEMVRLSAAGWSPPKIAVHLQISEQRVRHYLKAFLTGGFDALPDRRHPGMASPLTPAMEEAIRQELRKDERIWTAPQLAEWVATQFRVRLTPDALARRLKRARIAWKRTSRSLKHKQKPEEVAAQKEERAAQDKKGEAGEIDIADLDEAGFAPTLPTSYSWYPVGERLSIPYEAPQGRRVNAIGLYFSRGPQAGRFLFETTASLPAPRARKARQSLAEQAATHGLRPEQGGKIDSERLIAFIWQAAGRPAVHDGEWRRERPLVIWLDNYSVHRSERVQAELPEWERAGITLCYLPSYSPELSRIERVWHPVKHHEMVRRSHPLLGDLMTAVDEALTEKAADLLSARAKTDQLLLRAA
jgi:transposase